VVLGARFSAEFECTVQKQLERRAEERKELKMRMSTFSGRDMMCVLIKFTTDQRQNERRLRKKL
jgi:hypothetical protein